MQMIGRASCIWGKCQIWPSLQGFPSLKISLYILKSQNVSGGQLLHNTEPVLAQRNASWTDLFRSGRVSPRGGLNAADGAGGLCWGARPVDNAGLAEVWVGK